MKQLATLYCIIWKNGCGKDTASKIIGNALDLQSISIGDILRHHCIEQGLQISKELLANIGKTNEFNGEQLTKRIMNALPNWWIINGIRKSSTLHHLMQKYNCIKIGIQSEDTLRFKRCLARSRTWDDLINFEHFIEKEKRDNIYPYNIELLLSFCDICIPNNNYIHSFQKRLLSIQNTLPVIKNQFARCIIENEKSEILVLFDYQKWYYTLPWWKLKKETPEIAILRETYEEVWLECDPSLIEFRKSIIGKFWWIDWKGYYFRYKKKIQSQEIQNTEPRKHSLCRVKRSDILLPKYSTTKINTFL